MKKAILCPLFTLLLIVSCTDFAFAQSFFSTGKIDYDPSSGKFSLSEVPPLNGWPEAKEAPSWGIYLWEFGDGHYSFEEQPTHRYTKRGSYRVRLHLTPFYATNDPVSLQTRIDAPGKGRRSPAYDLGKKKALLESNSSDYIVPEQAFQLVTHYEAPSQISGEQGGYLFVFYNKKKEINFLFNAFELTSERTHYGEKDN